MLEKVLKYNGNAALDARGAANFVKESNKYSEEIWIEKGDKKVNGKSIMGIMSLASVKSGNITLCVDGDEETEVLKHLTEVLDFELSN